MKTADVPLKQSRELPPNWDRLVVLFNPDWKHVAVTYGDTCHSAKPLSPDLVVHESVHVTQQGSNPAAWWERYCVEPEFRLSQELEAYRAQYRWLKANVRDRNALHRERDRLARDLSGAMYGRIIGFAEAFTGIGS